MGLYRLLCIFMGPNGSLLVFILPYESLWVLKCPYAFLMSPNVSL